MSSFQEYADYYDLFYQDKPYGDEAQFVMRSIAPHVQEVRTVLDLGCGTGRYAVEFARMGLSIEGVDLSEQMVARARARADQLPPDLRIRLQYRVGDIRAPSNITASKDLVVCLFHVLNYQTDNASLHAAFRTARAALRPGGAFAFDFWYGPAVLRERPVMRVKRLQTPQGPLYRLAQPDLDINANRVDVCYTVLALRPDVPSKEITEVHRMRYLFLPELEMLATANGFRLVKLSHWMSDELLDESAWSGYAVALAC